MTLNLGDITDNVIALYFDPSAKGLQELIKLNINDLTPIVDLEGGSRLSLLNDNDLIKHFVHILNISEDLLKKQTTQESKLLVKQLSLSILKSIQYLIATNGSDFLSSL